jgi:hypothetical protein
MRRTSIVATGRSYAAVARRGPALAVRRSAPRHTPRVAVCTLVSHESIGTDDQPPAE